MVVNFCGGGGLYLDGCSESKMEYCWIYEWGLSCLASRANPSLFHRTQSVQPCREYFTKIYPFTYVILPTQLTFTPPTQAPTAGPPPFSSSLRYLRTTTRLHVYLPALELRNDAGVFSVDFCKLLVTIARGYGDRDLDECGVCKSWKFRGVGREMGDGC